MPKDDFNDILAFISVVREGSFTRAAAKFGISPSALSHAISGLEKRLRTPLLVRTTRKLSMTEVGEKLYLNVAPRFEEIDAELRVIGEMHDRPVGTVRISTAEHAANSVLWPKLAPVMHEWPEMTVEITVDYTLSDIVSQRYDAGVRVGNQVAKDMIAVCIGPDMRVAVVGTPEYFAKRKKPQTPQDLTFHQCLNLRLPTHGGLLPWDFEKNGHEIKVQVKGPWIFNSSVPILRAALAGYGLAFIPEDMALEHIKAGRLIRVLNDWCQPYPGYHLYYPNRRQNSRALEIVIEALRYRA
ncbi:LysR family transcriptional regulator [Herbaspirillum chlorophenolicum]|uniref:LysR family transcriptional regulator n=1 Tax=Herbaspirillum chlorophenolicum TaxID=211589 RepID=A0ABW8EXT1_9BURK